MLPVPQLEEYSVPPRAGFGAWCGALIQHCKGQSWGMAKVRLDTHPLLCSGHMYCLIAIRSRLRQFGSKTYSTNLWVISCLFIVLVAKVCFLREWKQTFGCDPLTSESDTLHMDH